MFSCNAELRSKTPELKLVKRMSNQVQEAEWMGSCKMGLSPFFRSQASHFFSLCLIFFSVRRALVLPFS